MVQIHTNSAPETHIGVQRIDRNTPFSFNCLLCYYTSAPPHIQWKRPRQQCPERIIKIQTSVSNHQLCFFSVALHVLPKFSVMLLNFVLGMYI